MLETTHPLRVPSEPESSDEVSITVVYVEDDARLARLTSQYLCSHGMVVHPVDRGDAALGVVLAVRPDVVLLDLMLPGKNGLEVCRAIRRHLDVPVVMVTARDEEADRVMGLEGGADDYVVKPFSSRELVARIRAQARRARGRAGPRTERVTVAGLELDSASMSASLDGAPLALTSYEFALLRVLAERSGRALTREQILLAMHGSAEDAFDRSIDVLVSRLRQKLEANPASERILVTVRGVGYMLAPGRKG